MASLLSSCLLSIIVSHETPAEVNYLRRQRGCCRPVEASILIKGAHRYELLYHQTVP